MLEKLTKAQESLMSVVRDEWINSALSGDTSIKEDLVRDWVEFCYSLINRKAPRIEIVDSPEAAQKAANALNGNKKMVYYPMGTGLGYDSGWTSFYDFFTRIGVINNEKLNRWMKFKEAGIWDCLLFENIAYIIRRPSVVKKDASGRLHCEDGLAVMFADGWGLFMWHGTKVSGKIIMDPDNITRDEVLSEKNSEVVRAYAERLGWEKYFKIADVVRIDQWTDPKTGLFYELYDFKNRLGENQPRLLKMESPEVKDGTKPQYIEPVDPRLTSCQAARKWQFMKNDATWPTPQECNSNPNLSFEVEA